MQWVCLAYLSLALGACLAIPYEEELPYADDLPVFEEGLTLKEEVRRRLFEPQAYYSGGSEWVYAADRLEWQVLALMRPYYGEGREIHLLVLGFDDRGILEKLQFEVLSEWRMSNCTDSGFCFGGHKQFIRLASEAEDQEAKSFTSPPFTCGLYYFGAPSNWDSAQSVILDGQKQGAVFVGNLFYHWILQTGQHTLAVTPGIPRIKVDCVGDELFFITLKSGGFLSGEIEFTQLEESKGRAKIRKRHLIRSESGHE